MSGGLPLTLSDAAAALRRGDASSVELTTALFERADELDPVLGTYMTRFDETALAAAAQADADFAAGTDRGPLQGIPLGVKDIIAAREGPTTACSLVLDPNWGRGVDAPVVARLREQGAVITGKTTTMEFAMGGPDPDGPFPAHRNPWDLERWPGGSSAGTGTGVAAGLIYGGLGSDTGGSVRIPSALCGISGIKTTFGLVPKSGVVPLGYSLDTVGPMARTARDCALILQTIAGHSGDDPTSVDRPVPDYTAALVGNASGLRVGVERDHHSGVEGFDADCRDRFEDAIRALADAGAEIVDVRFDNYPLVTAAAMVTVAGEAFAYHRKDLQERWQDYGREARSTLSMGAFYSSGDYVQAQRVRAMGLTTLRGIFERCDVLATPTIGVGAPRIGDNYWQMMAWTYTPAWNLLGSPAMSVPMGFIGDNDAVGLQLIGPHFDESGVLRVADAYQQMTDWHLQLPPVLATSSH